MYIDFKVVIDFVKWIGIDVLVIFYGFFYGDYLEGFILVF